MLHFRLLFSACPSLSPTFFLSISLPLSLPPSLLLSLSPSPPSLSFLFFLSFLMPVVSVGCDQAFSSNKIVAHLNFFKPPLKRLKFVPISSKKSGEKLFLIESLQKKVTDVEIFGLSVKSFSKTRKKFREKVIVLEKIVRNPSHRPSIDFA